MDKASVYGTGDSRFESWQGHFCDFVLAAVLSAVPNRGLECGWCSYGAICIEYSNVGMFWAAIENTTKNLRPFSWVRTDADQMLPWCNG